MRRSGALQGMRTILRRCGAILAFVMTVEAFSAAIVGQPFSLRPIGSASRMEIAVSSRLSHSIGGPFLSSRPIKIFL